MNETPVKYAYVKVKDARNHDVRGLWIRNGRFYAQMRVPGKASSVKVPLLDETGRPLETVPQARDALNALLAKRSENTLPPLQKTCTLGEYIDLYLEWLDDAKPKDPLTIKKEKHTLRLWKARIGTIRLAFLQPSHIEQFITERRKDTNRKGQPITNRTINLDIIALNNALNRAMKVDKLIGRLPTEHWVPLEHVYPRRPLWTREQLEKLCQAAIGREYGQLFSDYVRFMAASGARCDEAAHVAWSHVNWERRSVTLDKTKFGHPRDVDFNADLEALLKDMLSRRVPDSQWLFPSPRSGGRDVPITTLQNTLRAARDAAGLTKAAGFKHDFTLHDCRHYFISEGVMRGIDYMTLAAWSGHKDGGCLIGKVYGHLNNPHTKKQAEKMFQPPAPAPAPAPATPPPAATPPLDVNKLLEQMARQNAQMEQQNTLIQQLLAAKAA